MSTIPSLGDSVSRLGRISLVLSLAFVAIWASSCGDDASTVPEPALAPQVIAAVMLSGSTAEILVLSDFDPSYKVTPAPAPGERAITWKLVDPTGAVIDSGEVVDTRVAVAEFEADGTPSPIELELDWGVVEIVLPNVEGEVVFAARAAPPTASGAPPEPTPLSRLDMIVKGTVNAIWSPFEVDLGTVERLDSHAPCRPVNILLSADGFTKDALAEAKKEAKNVASGLYDNPGFKPYWQETALWWLPVASKDSGISDPGCQMCGDPKVDKPMQQKDTAFAMTFGKGDLRHAVVTDIEKLKLKTSYAQLLAAKRQVDADVIGIMINTEEYLGAAQGFEKVGAVFSFSGGHALRKLVFAHELGHALVGLADEYFPEQACSGEFQPADAANEKNVSNDLTKLPWSDLVNTSSLPTTVADKTTVGAYEGGNYCKTGVYRPQHDCFMRTTETKTPCAVCSREIGRAYEAEGARRAQPGAVCLTSDSPPGEGGAGQGGGGGGGEGSGWGQIVLGEHVGSELEYQAQVAAMFADEASDFCPQGCTLTTVESCMLREYVGPPGGIAATFVGGGAITFSGNALSGPVTLEEPVPATLYTAFLEPKVWLGGESLVVQSTGGMVPAFEVMGVTPAPLTITGPPRPGPGWVLDRSSGLTLSWQPIDATVTLNFSRGTSFGEPMSWSYTTISCLFEGATGTGTLPGELLELVPAHETPFGMTDEGPGQLSLGRGRYDSVSVGNYEVQTSIIGPAFWEGALGSERFWLE